MRVDPKGIVSEIGLSDAQLPATLICPICSASGKLEARSHYHMVCRNCGFIGDVIQLFSVTHKLTIDSTLDVLKAKGLLEMGEAERQTYVQANVQQDKLRKLLTKQSHLLVTQPHGSILAMLSSYGCRYQPADLAKLTPHVIPLHREQLDELELEYPKAAKETLRWWAKYMALAIPCWSGVAIVGFWLITPSGYMYLPLTEQKGPETGFALVSRISDDVTFVVDSPIQALRLTLWSIVHTGRPHGFLVPHGDIDGIASYKSKSCVYWSPERHTAWFFRALNTPKSKTLIDYEIRDGYNPRTDLPCGGSYAQFTRYVDAYAKQAEHALGIHLLSLPLEQARAELCGMAIDPTSKTRCLAYAHGDDHERLSRIFEEHVQTSTITWNGETITETEAGWVYKGKVISSAVLHMDEIRPIGASGDAWITGNITHAGQTISFREKFSVMRKHTTSWLQRLVISNSGRIPFVERSWGSKLIEVAQQFHTPKAVMTGASYGWNDGVLQLAKFAVDKHGVSPSRASVDGPSLPAPAGLTESEIETMWDNSTCMLYLLLLGGLLQTHSGESPPGILIVDSLSLIPRIADALGDGMHPVDSLPGLGIKPLPILAVDRDISSLFVTKSPCYAMVNSTSATASLATLFHPWMSVQAGGGLDARVLRGVFLDLPEALKLDLGQRPQFYRVLSRFLCDKYKIGQFVRAGSDLDKQVAARTDSLPAAVMELIARLARTGVLEVEESSEECRVGRKRLYEHAAQAGVVIPQPTQLTDILSKGGSLIGSNSTSWTFSPYAWNFYKSFA